MKFQRIAAILLVLGLSGWAEESPKVSIPELLRPETRLRAFQQYALQAKPDDAKKFAWAEISRFADWHQDIRVSELKRGEEPSHYLVTWETLDDHWPRASQPSSSLLLPRERLSYQLFSEEGTPLLPQEGSVRNGIIADLNGDGEAEIIESISSSIDGETSKRDPATPESRKQAIEFLQVHPNGVWHGLGIEASLGIPLDTHPPFGILFNTHPNERAAENTWGFQIRDTGRNGLYEIELGPVTASGGVVPKVIFRWDAAKRGWMGPEPKPGDHFRVITGGNIFEETRRIAADGGLGYPLAPQPKAEPKPSSPEAVSHSRDAHRIPAEHLSKPYRYQSAGKLSDEKLFAFLSARPSAWEYLSERMQKATAVEDLWTLDPQAAALAYVRRNRPPPTYSRHLLGVDNPAHERPPMEGDLTLFDGPSLAGTFVHSLHCAREGSYLAYAASVQYWHDVSALEIRTQYEFRKLDLSYAQARRILQTVWWMSRIRSRQLTSDSSMEFMSGGSTSDGFATVRIAAKESNLTVTGTRSANHPGTFLGVGEFDETYSTSAFINLVVQLFQREIPDRLGHAWKAQEIPLRWNEARRAPEAQTDQELARIKVLTADFLRLFRERRLAAGIAVQAVMAVGERGWHDLRPEVEQISGMLPPLLDHEKRLEGIAAQLKEWEEKLGADASEKAHHKRERRRFAMENPSVRQTPGWNVKPLTAEESAKFAEVDALYDLRNRVRYQAPQADLDFAELRRMISFVRRQLDHFDDAEALFRWAAEEEAATGFVLSRLVKIDRNLAIALLRRCEEKEEGEMQQRYYANAWKALTAATLDEASLDAAARARLIMTLRNTEADDAERESALEALVPRSDPKRYPDPAIDDALLEFLVQEFPTLDELPIAIARRLGPKAWEALLQYSNRVDNYGIPHLHQGLPALTLIAQAEPDPYRAKLRDILAGELQQNNGYLDTSLWSIWQLDLRELKPEIERIATSGPEDYEGTFGSGGINHKQPVDQRYHRARHIAALWNEEDPLTRARLLVAFALTEARTFSHTQNGALERLQNQLAAERAGLTKAQVSALEKFVTWCETHAPAKLANRASPTQLTQVIAATRTALGIAP